MRASPHRATRTARALLALALLLTAGLSGCRRSEPVAMRYDGTESCELCRMAVTDSRYGAQLVTRTGKSRSFDSIECLASYYAQAARGDGEPPRAWVGDFTRPRTLVRVDSARFLRTTGSRSSPMGRGLLAVGPAADLNALQRELGGTTLDWPGVLALVAREGLAPRDGLPADAGEDVAHAH
jgi:copper chaperone NosL